MESVLFYFKNVYQPYSAHRNMWHQLSEFSQNSIFEFLPKIMYMYFNNKTAFAYKMCANLAKI